MLKTLPGKDIFEYFIQTERAILDEQALRLGLSVDALLPQPVGG